MTMCTLSYSNLLNVQWAKKKGNLAYIYARLPLLNQKKYIDF